jgi:pimeloyl-ACP methyl ester carboxylesterase
MGRRPSVEERLREIAVPVLVVTGAKDRVFRPAHARTLATEIPAGQFHLLPDTGHAVVVERPGLSADLADALVERVRCSASP